MDGRECLLLTITMMMMMRDGIFLFLLSLFPPAAPLLYLLKPNYLYSAVLDVSPTYLKFGHIRPSMSQTSMTNDELGEWEGCGYLGGDDGFCWWIDGRVEVIY